MRTEIQVGTLCAGLLAVLGLTACSDVADEPAGQPDGGSGGADPAKRWPPLSTGPDVSHSDGFVRTPSGVLHRPTATDEVCANRLDTLPPPPPIPDVDGGVPACDEKPYGYPIVVGGSGGFVCGPSQPPPTPRRYLCVYGCVTDSDCDANSICWCTGHEIGSCIEAGCRADGDCGDGNVCAINVSKLACRTMECRVSADCRAGTECIDGSCVAYGNECRNDSHCQAGKVCTRGSCTQRVVCGRPFLVDGRDRVAAVAARDDYASPVSPRVQGLTVAEQSRLDAHWTDIGLMEHASIAAFARFALQLLQLGAPAALVDGAQRALGDELRHAQLAFGLASAFAGDRRGPGTLDMSGALVEASFVDIVRTAFREACVGETIAACEAIAAREAAADPAVRAVLARIAEDESTHAGLGFGFVRWALSVASPEDAVALGALLHAELASLENACPPASVVGIPSHGLLSSDARSAARAGALRDVIRPCVTALLAGRPSRSRHDAGLRDLV